MSLRTALVACCAVFVTSVALMAQPASAKPGDLDRSFGDRGRVVTPGYGDEVQVAGGLDDTIVAAAGKTIFRYLPDGSLDPSFGEDGKLTIAEPEGLPFRLRDLTVDPEGRVILFGAVAITDVYVLTNYMSMAHPDLAAVIRYDSAGELDSSFGKGGFLLTDFGQPHHGSAYVPTDSGELRYDPAYDKAFTSASRGMVDREGRLIVIGSVGEIVSDDVRSHFEYLRKLVVRLTPDGQVDPSFGVDGVVSEPGFNYIDGLALGPDNTLLLAGKETPGGGSEALTRLRPDGGIDRSFGRAGTRSGHFPSSLTDIAVDRFGRIVTLAGRAVRRFTPRGKLDRRFGHRGTKYVRLARASSLSTLVAEPSGRILLAGTQVLRLPEARPDGTSEQHSYLVIRLNRHGRPDRRFGRRGWVVTRFGKRSSVLGQEAFIDHSGRLVVGGPIARPDLAPTGGIALARYRLGR